MVVVGSESWTGSSDALRPTTKGEDDMAATGITTRNYTDSQLEDTMNQARCIYLRHLLDKKFIGQEDFETLSKTTMFVVKKPSMIRALYRKIFKKEEDSERFIVAKIEEQKP